MDDQQSREPQGQTIRNLLTLRTTEEPPTLTPFTVTPRQLAPPPPALSLHWLGGGSRPRPEDVLSQARTPPRGVPVTVPFRPEPRQLIGPSTSLPLALPIVALPGELLPYGGAFGSLQAQSALSPVSGGGVSPVGSPSLAFTPPLLSLAAAPVAAPSPAALARLKRQEAEQAKKRRKGTLPEAGGPSSAAAAAVAAVPPAVAAAGGAGGVGQAIIGDVVKEDRKRKRLLRNRVSAQQARERKKSYVQNLQQHVDELAARSAELEQVCSKLVQENEDLRQTVKANIGKKSSAGPKAASPSKEPSAVTPPVAGNGKQQGEDSLLEGLEGGG